MLASSRMYNEKQQFKPLLEDFHLHWHLAEFLCTLEFRPRKMSKTSLYLPTPIAGRRGRRVAMMNEAIPKVSPSLLSLPLQPKSGIMAVLRLNLIQDDAAVCFFLTLFLTSFFFFLIRRLFSQFDIHLILWLLLLLPFPVALHKLNHLRLYCSSSQILHFQLARLHSDIGMIQIQEVDLI